MVSRSNVVSLLCAALVVVGLFAGSAIPRSAAAVEFDKLGRAETTAAFAEGFEDDLTSDEYVGAAPSYSGEASLEGDRTLVVGGDTSQVFLNLPREKFEGRRVNVRLWYRPRGTRVTPMLFWSSRQLRSFALLSPLSLGLGSFHRTGRATTDGWIEMESGPVDWEFAAAGGPVALVLSDAQFTRNEQLARDESNRVQVDALEIEDLGPAKVPRADCNLGNEDDKCGSAGVCVLGKCVDAAAALGTLPRGDMRETYLDRRSFLVEQLHAIRKGRPNLSKFSSIVESLTSAPPKEVWSRFVDAWEHLRDGHGTPPSNRALRIRNQGGVCLGPGRADLLPIAPKAPVPMVFQAEEPLEKGDVLTAIDGLSVSEWRERASRYLYYRGDPAGRRALQVNAVLRAAIYAGSTVEFTRCERSASNRDTPCSPAETQTIQIDYGEKVGSTVWEGEDVSSYFRDNQYCDFRFDALRSRSVEIERWRAHFADTDGGIRRAEFHGTPRNTAKKQDAVKTWMTAWRENLSDRPDRMIVDERRGLGGWWRALHFLGDLFLKDSTRIDEVKFSWFGSELTDRQMEELRTCYDEISWRCGHMDWDHVQYDPKSELAADSKVALLTGQTISTNDYFTRYMTARSGPTRIFGYAPTYGAFGTNAEFPPLPGELVHPHFQHYDTQFRVDRGGMEPTWGPFTSGTGIEPDAVVYQKQSDAVAGVDSVVEAAKQWLETSR